MDQKIVLLIALAGVVLVAGCVQQFSSDGVPQDDILDENINIGAQDGKSQEQVFEEVNIGCLPGLVDSSVSFVVRNQDEYDALLVEYYEKTKEKYKELWGVETDEELNKGLPFKDCDAKLIPIDFEKYTLLSHYAKGSGCTTEFKKYVLIDELNKKVIFTIDVIENGSCEPVRRHRSSILIPKIPDDYSVDFNVL